MSNRIIKFIKDNDLDFSSTDSGLNSNCVILSGYALHLDIDNIDELAKELKGLGLSWETYVELDRVYSFAKANNYGKYWESDLAKKTYKF